MERNRRGREEKIGLGIREGREEGKNRRGEEIDQKIEEERR